MSHYSQIWLVVLGSIEIGIAWTGLESSGEESEASASVFRKWVVVVE